MEYLQFNELQRILVKVGLQKNESTKPQLFGNDWPLINIKLP